MNNLIKFGILSSANNQAPTTVSTVTRSFDFEDGLNPWTYGSYGSVTASVSAAQAHGGAQSWFLDTSSSAKSLSLYDEPMILNGSFSLSGWFYTVSSSGNMLLACCCEDSDTLGYQFRVDQSANKIKAYDTWYNTQMGLSSDVATLPISANAWYKMELTVLTTNPMTFNIKVFNAELVTIIDSNIIDTIGTRTSGYWGVGCSGDTYWDDVVCTYTPL